MLIVNLLTLKNCSGSSLLGLSFDFLKFSSFPLDSESVKDT